MGYKVESGIAIPKSRGNGLNNRRYPWNEMGIGDSFFVPCEKDEQKRMQSVLNSCSRNRSKGCGEKHTTRVVKGGIRVWRIV